MIKNSHDRSHYARSFSLVRCANASIVTAGVNPRSPDRPRTTLHAKMTYQIEHLRKSSGMRLHVGRIRRRNILNLQ
jgi:hypothetical protein